MTHDFTRNSSLSCDNLITSLGNKYNNTKNLPSKKAGCTMYNIISSFYLDDFYFKYRHSVMLYSNFFLKSTMAKGSAY